MSFPPIDKIVHSDTYMDASDSNAIVAPAIIPKRHASRYLTLATFQVEDQLYRIPKDLLPRYSEVFEGMFLVGDGTDGHEDDCPIVLEGYRSKDFDSLLKVLMPEPFATYPPELPKEEWIGVLDLSTIWQMEKARALSIQMLNKDESFTSMPVDMVVIARKYRVKDWLAKGLNSLANSAHAIDIENMAEKLGWETSARISYVANKARHLSDQAREAQVAISRIKCIGCNTNAVPPVKPSFFISPCSCGGFEYTTPRNNFIHRHKIAGWWINDSPSQDQTSLEESHLDVGKMVQGMFEEEFKSLGDDL